LTCQVKVSDSGEMASIALFSAFASSLFNINLTLDDVQLDIWDGDFGVWGVMQPSSDTRVPAQQAAAIVSKTADAADPITFYHWLVVIFASCGWLFDCMGQRIFVLSREPCKCQSLLLTQAQLLLSLRMGLGLHIQQVGRRFNRSSVKASGPWHLRRSLCQLVSQKIAKGAKSFVVFPAFCSIVSIPVVDICAIHVRPPPDHPHTAPGPTPCHVR